MPELSFATLNTLAARCGLAVVGYTDAAPLDADVARLAAWQSAGYAGEMGFMGRDADSFGSPRRFVSTARSVIVFAVRYSAAPLPPRPAAAGRVARYAWGLDYHTVLAQRLSDLHRLIEAACGTVRARVFTDAVPLLERALAARGGLGFIGKNTLLITPRVGSFSFLGEMISDLEIRCSPLAVVDGGCGSCFRCAQRCPTNAIVAPFRLDARRCISYLTIEKRTGLSWEERAALGEWIFGCDVGQDVCPFNHAPLKRGQPADWGEFESGNGVGPWLDLRTVLSLRSEREFQRRFTGTALLRGRRKTLVRNAAIVAANGGEVALTRALAERASDDASPLVRSHCLWAVWVLERRFGAGIVDPDELLERGRGDPSEEVRREVALIEEAGK
jgi:epoxyqueuosine reductase